MVPQESERILQCIDRIQDRTIRNTALSSFWLHGVGNVSLQEQISQRQRITQCELDMEKHSTSSNPRSLDELIIDLLNQVETWNEETKCILECIVERLSLGRQAGEIRVETEVALLHHALCLDEIQTSESSEKSCIL